MKLLIAHENVVVVGSAKSNHKPQVKERLERETFTRNKKIKKASLNTLKIALIKL